jgi:hypothetical protein
MLNARSWMGHAFTVGAASIIMAAGAGVCLAAEESPVREEDPVARMREEIDELKAQVRALKEQVDALVRTSTKVAAPAPPLPAIPAQPAPRTAPASGGNVFNPAISVVFQGIGSSSINHNRDDDGFSLSEAEIGFQAAVDPYARVDLFLTFSAEGEAEVEEGFVTFTALPGGLQARGGRFKNFFGKWNELHDHRFFTVDRPNVLTNLFGDEGLATDGASLSWMVPGTGSVYLESITEVGSTGNDVSFNARRRDLLWTQRINSLFTLTPNATLGVGLSSATGMAGPSERLIEAIDDAGLTGVVEPAERLASNVFGLDLTWKWKPVQFGLYRSFTWQTELLESNRRVESLDGSGLLTRETVRSLGLYSLAEYQFAKRWRAGLRYDWAGFPDEERARERAVSAVMRIQPTEFQEFRIQFKHSGRNDAAAARFDGDHSENEIFIEWIPAIGAHAAHKY